MSPEAWQAAAMWFGTIVELLIKTLWLVIAWRLMSWWLHDRNGMERNPAQTLRYGIRRIFCKHQKGYANIRDAYHRNYTACVHCGQDMNQGRRMEDRI